MKIGQSIYQFERHVDFQERCNVVPMGLRIISFDDETIVAQGKCGIAFVSRGEKNLFLSEEAALEFLQEVKADMEKVGREILISHLTLFDRGQAKPVS